MTEVESQPCISKHIQPRHDIMSRDTAKPLNGHLEMLSRKLSSMGRRNPTLTEKLAFLQSSPFVFHLFSKWTQFAWPLKKISFELHMSARLPCSTTKKNVKIISTNGKSTRCLQNLKSPSLPPLTGSYLDLHAILPLSVASKPKSSWFHPHFQTSIANA